MFNPGETILIPASIINVDDGEPGSLVTLNVLGKVFTVRGSQLPQKEEKVEESPKSAPAPVAQENSADTATTATSLEPDAKAEQTSSPSKNKK